MKQLAYHHTGFSSGIFRRAASSYCRNVFRSDGCEKAKKRPLRKPVRENNNNNPVKQRVKVKVMSAAAVKTTQRL